MSSTYVHYGSGPSSLPNDYAILSQFIAASRDENEEDNSEQAIDDDDEHEENDLDGRGRNMLSPPIMGYGSASSSPKIRRTSFGTETIGQGHRKTSFGAHSVRSPHWRAPEEQPLLAAIPRIDEECDTSPVNNDDDSWFAWLQEAKIISQYTLPVFGTHLLEYSLSMASVISIGHISTTHLAAATLGSMTASVTGLSIILGFVSALDSLLPQAWTSPNPKLVGLWSQRMTFLMLGLLVPIFMVWQNAEWILLGLKQEPDVAHLAGVYLKWISIGLPAYGFNTISRRYFQSQGLLHVPTTIVIIVAPINAVMNWLLVWGPPAFRLGYIGAPIATGLSFNLIAICTLIYGCFFAPTDAWHPIGRDSFKNVGVLVQLGLAGVGQLAAEWWSWELIGLAASFLGPATLAAQSVLLVSASTSYQAPYALSVAASVRIGNLLGAGHPHKAKVATSVSLLLSLVIGFVFSILFLSLRNKWAYLFNDDPLVVTLVSAILPLVSVFQIFDGLCAVTGGILRARGRQSIGALLNFTAYYVIGIPLGLLLTFKYNMELYGLWIGLATALLYSAIISVWIVLRTDWVLEIQRVARRLAADNKLHSTSQLDV